MALIIDIETVQRELSATEIEQIKAGIKPAGNIKDPVKIEADIEKKFTAKMSKLALDPLHNQIVAISGRLHTEPQTPIPLFNLFDEAEDILLATFIDEVSLLADEVRGEIYPFVGANIIGFDLPTIALHLAKYQIDPQGLNFMPAKYNRKQVVDLMLGEWYSTNKLADFFGIDRSHNPITGAQVQKYWDKGDLKTIAEHCRIDVEVEYLIYDRLHKLFIQERR